MVARSALRVAGRATTTKTASGTSGGSGMADEPDGDETAESFRKSNAEMWDNFFNAEDGH